MPGFAGGCINVEDCACCICDTPGSFMSFLFFAGDFKLELEPFDEMVVVGDVLTVLGWLLDTVDDPFFGECFDRTDEGFGPVFLCDR